MSKLTLTPNSGLATEQPIFSVTGIPYAGRKRRIRVENATHGISVAFVDHGVGAEIREITDGHSEIKGYIDMKIPEHSSQAVISIFATIEEEKDGTWKPVSMLSSTYNIAEPADEEFDGKVTVNPSFVGPTDKATIEIDYKPKSRVVFAINDRRFAVLTDTNGHGSISFRGSDVLTTKTTPVVQKFFVNAYTAVGNYTKKLFTGSYLHVLPAKIALFASPTYCDELDTSSSQENCRENDPFCNLENLASVGGLFPTPLMNFGNVAGTTGDEPLVEEVKTPELIEGDEPIVIPDHSVTHTALGVPIHGFVGVNKDGSSEIEVNPADPTGTANETSIAQPRVYLAAGKPSVKNASVSESRTGVVAPNDGNIVLYVDKDVYDDVAIENFVQLKNDTFGHSFYQIVSKIEPDEYTPFYRLELDADLNVTEFIFCVPYTIVDEGVEVADAIGFESPLMLPIIQDVIGVPAVPVSVSVASSSTKLYDGESFTYVIAQAVTGGSSQLYFYATTLGSSRQTFGWKQLTFKGENKNPKAVCDSQGNIHIFWESDRSGLNQIYYGILGPSAFSAVNAVLCASTEKHIELTNRVEKSFEYTINPLVFELNSPTDVSLYRIIDEYTLASPWMRNDLNSGFATVTDDTNLRIQGNPAVDQSLIWGVFDKDESGDRLDGSFDQRSFQIEFTLKDNDANTVYTDEEIKNQFDAWLATYSPDPSVLQTNANVYSKSDNKFTIEMFDRHFDRMIPIFGSYKNLNLNDDYYDFLTDSSERFTAIVSGCNATVRHFMLGLMPEKVRFKATNVQTYIDFCEARGGSLDDCREDYIVDDEVVVYTGRYRLAIVLNTLQQNSADSAEPVAIVREVSEPFSIDGDGQLMRAIVHYKKMMHEDAALMAGRGANDDSFTAVRYMGSLFVAMGSNIVFSEAFRCDFCAEDFADFHLGFGFPGGGRFTSNKFQAYETAVFDYNNVDLVFEDIKFGVPNMLFDPNLVVLGNEYRNTNSLNIKLTETDDWCTPTKFGDVYGWLNMGLTTNNLPQIPLTFEGQNQSPDAIIGPFCQDVHLVWQSNRSRYWDVYYSMSLPQTLPFRFDTRITATETHSLMPRISINNNGVRMIVWHENRNNQYQVYAAKGDVNPLLCSFEDCGSINRTNVEEIDGTGIDGLKECVVEFQFCYNPCEDYDLDNANNRPEIIVV